MAALRSPQPTTQTHVKHPERPSHGQQSRQENVYKKNSEGGTTFFQQAKPNSHYLKLRMHNQAARAAHLSSQKVSSL